MLTSSAKHVAGLITLAFVCLLGFSAGDIVLDDVDTIASAQKAIYSSVFEWRSGDLFGVSLFASLLLGACFLFAAVLMARDGERPAEEVVETPQTAPSYWPVGVAVGAGIAAVGLVADTLTFVFGCIIAGIAAFEWIINSWTDRHSTNAEANATFRGRLMAPFEIPVFTVVIMGLAVIMLSRVFLAGPKTAAAIVGIVLSVIIFSVFFVLYIKPDVAPRNVLTGGAVLGAVALLVAGVVAAAIGPRDFEIHVGDHATHHDDEEHGEDHSDEEGAALPGAPVVVAEAG